MNRDLLVVSTVRHTSAWVYCTGKAVTNTRHLAWKKRKNCYDSLTQNIYYMQYGYCTVMASCDMSLNWTVFTVLKSRWPL